eukprot:CAMPEP_0206625990 /NCGR_PEP_ID=MMETSP0325_2-20121206/65049_1 /ASSEMBLY_ACC=CAM_ASM_000347 /TAXON_ID=2866 /ORGANISM="Crypthecodinium cohnii, Strain Seligo" /LENGTH=54 /DNA_ID=CAMNT_0054150249 /DNA_START=1 /DNA_END=162 /DNA_ORIENTATION=+
MSRVFFLFAFVVAALAALAEEVTSQEETTASAVGVQEGKVEAATTEEGNLRGSN